MVCENYGETRDLGDRQIDEDYTARQYLQSQRRMDKCYQQSCDERWGHDLDEFSAGHGFSG